MKLTVDELARIVGGKVIGNGDLPITNVAGLLEATSTDVSYLKDAKDPVNLKNLALTKAGAVMVPRGFSQAGKTLIEVENPMASFVGLLNKIAQEKIQRPSGIHPLASVAANVKIGNNVTIGPFCIVEENAELADDVWLMGQNFIGRNTRIGKASLLYPQVVVREEIAIGERCIVHPGSVIGADGYGFFFMNGKHNKIPQIGTVIIEDDVEIGACTTIDRATIGATIIRKGTKIDNLVQVAHNVEIGDHSLMAAQVGIAGSCKIGKGVVMGGQSGVADHTNIKDRTQVGGQAGVIQDTEPGDILWGIPAHSLKDVLREAVFIRRLPELFKDVKSLKEKNKKNG